MTTQVPGVTGSIAKRYPQGGLVDLVSGSFGAGHDAAARAIAAQFEEQGHPTRIWDIVDFMPGYVGQAMRAAYRSQVQMAPSSYRWLLRHTETGRRAEWLIQQALRSVYRPLLHLATASPLAVISTHPFASQALGDLRARRRLHVPVVTYLTDMSVHPAWVHPSVDLHLALHELPAEGARRAGAVATAVVQPAVAAPFADLRFQPRSRAAARRALGLPANRRLLLVTGGSEGLGELERTAYEIAASEVGTPVVLCGHNRRLLRRLSTDSSLIALGWTEQMPQLLAASDCVVQNAGGMSSLEALAAGVPVVTYRCIAGHGETNAAALDRAGLVPWIRSSAQLREGLGNALARPSGLDPWALIRGHRPDVVQAVVSPPLRQSA